MKAVVISILFLCFGLLGAHNHAHATVHNGKLSYAATHNILHQQQVEANNFIDVEDENDDKDASKKLPNQARWISLIATALFSIDRDDHSENYLANGRHLLHTGSQILIEQRVLRI